MNRHLIAGERYHPRAEFDMQRVQWGCFKVRLVQSGLPVKRLVSKEGPSFFNEVNKPDLILRCTAGPYIGSVADLKGPIVRFAPEADMVAQSS